jgi:enoyl-CoA hydratase/3-hydroxyacyl-CoA dehydrogenase
MSKKSRYDTILVEKKGGVLWLSFNRPGRMNSFNMDMIDETYAAIEEADADEEVRCILVKGEGDKAIHGFALGGGLEFALACDFRVAAESASMGSPEINLGIIPGWGGTQRLPRLLGLARAKKLVLLGDRIKADEALEIGLVHKVVPLDSLYEEAESLAQKLAAGPPVAMKVAKKAMNEGSEVSLKDGLKIEAESFGILAETEDIVEGLSAFFERRKAEFKGK